MKLEYQVCSLGPAKRLKELGVKQESLFFWHLLEEPFVAAAPSTIGDDILLCAFTVAELGEMLPSFIEVKGHDLALSWYRDDNGQHYLSYHGYGKSAGSMYGHKEKARTEADARAKMLIHLLERKRVEI